MPSSLYQHHQIPSFQSIYTEISEYFLSPNVSVNMDSVPSFHADIKVESFPFVNVGTNIQSFICFLKNVSFSLILSLYVRKPFFQRC